MDVAREQLVLIAVDRSLATRRWRVSLALVAALVLATLAVVEAGSPEAIGADTTTSSTIPGPVIPLASFPVQGKCYFIDTFGAARSGGRLHDGVDLMAKAGQYVYAVANGTLTKQYVDATGSLSGNGWRLTTSDSTYYFYAHLSGFPPGLALGSRVVAGQIIGFVGSSGNAGTPHLHFEIHPGGGAAINPTPSVKAIDGCNVTTIPTVATNPPNPTGPRDSPTATTPPSTTLAPAVRIPVTASTVPAITTPTSTTTPSPTSTTSTTSTTVAPTASTVASAPAPGAPAPATGNGRWTFVDPIVVFNGSGATALGANVTKQVVVTGGSESTATPAPTAVMVRVSATASSPGNVVVHPCSARVPEATTLSVEVGSMAIGTALVPVVSGTICVTSSMVASVKLTVVGRTSSSGSGLLPIATTRAFDTRSTGRLVAGARVTVAPATLGAKAGDAAVTASFTILDPSAAGTLSIAPCGGVGVNAPFTSVPLAAFSLVVPVSSTGLCVSSTVSADVVVDISGVWAGDGPLLAAREPVRVLGSSGAVATGPSPLAVAIAGVAGLPAALASATVHLTVIGATRAASVFVWPCDQPQPAAAVGVVAAARKATFVVAAAVTSGQICVASNAAASVVIDVSAVG
ncbi:MAG: M23 family metallopeptidase [Ilumatobacteraceae bacterium]